MSWHGKRQHSHCAHVTCLPFPTLSPQAAQADSFTDFPHSLMSVGKTTDNKTVSIFIQDDVTIHAAQDILITCQGANTHWDTHGCYRIPLWQPCQPSKRAQAALHNTNNVYDLPSTKQAIKWLHAMCGYPVKSSWMKAIKEGNFHGWPLLMATNVLKYYPETIETPKGHLNQTRKNVCSTKLKHPFKELHSNIYTKVYDTGDTIFTNQTGKSPLSPRPAINIS
eukprot:CCRYP_013229-RB/>CCRYP_013229-RB protein AED:0.40 eAED:0.41 QI:0/0/0/1/0/0/3/0/222